MAKKSSLRRESANNTGLIVSLIGVGFCTFLVFLFMSIILLTENNTAGVVKINALTANQVGQTQTVKFSWETDEDIEAVQVEIFHNGQKVYSCYSTNSTSLLKRELEIELFYGKFNAEVTLISNVKNSGVRSQEFILFADEYNIISFESELSDTICLQSLEEITSGSEIPTFVYFENKYLLKDFEFPENVFIIPTVNLSGGTESFSIYDVWDSTSLWIKELYESNTSSRFHLYYTDTSAIGILNATMGNRLPKTNYDITLISDGVTVYEFLNNEFNGIENAEEKFTEMKNKYNNLKLQISEDGGYDMGLEEKYPLKAEELKYYLLVIVSEEENIVWWIPNFTDGLADYLKQIFIDLENAGKIKFISDSE